jgi:hypothetical protein
MKNNIYLKIIVSLFLSILFTQLIYAQKLLKHTPIKQQVENSSLIVEGKVIAKRSYWDLDKKSIYTANTVEVYKVFKGEPILTIDVITAGGTIELFAQIVSPSLKLYDNDMGVFMLYKSDVKLNKKSKSVKNEFSPYGSLQGYYKYNLKKDLVINPFNKKQGIATGFYDELKSYIKTDYIQMKNFDVVSKQSELRKSVSLPPSSITFSPSAVSAGTQTVLTINGSGFGATEGTVSFSNSDDGGVTFVDALNSQVLTWSDTQITVEVPFQAGTGPIQVTDIGSSSASSSGILTISYSELNVVSDAVSPGTNVAYNTQHIDNNGPGGYTWRMFTGFNSNTSAKDAFVRAFNTWICSSNINWIIGSTTTIDAIADDNINVIRFDNGSELPVDVLGRFTSYWNGCFASGGSTLNWFVEELDIVFDDDTDWFYDIGLPAISQYDFESVALHELGHGHQLSHVSDTTFDGDNLDDVMHYALSNGEQQRVLSSNNITASNNVQSRSNSTIVCGEALMLDASCPLSVEEEIKTAITIYPNPVNNLFFIKNESSINLEKVVIYDISGRLISENDLSNSSTIKSISLVGVSKGVYFVNIHSESAILTKKIIID